MTASVRPILYGVPFSQPVRAVIWLLLYKQLPFELKLVNPGSKGESGSRNPAYLAKNPGGTIPTYEEPDSGFVLGEAHAIMCYLCNRHGWTDVYPDDPRQRARIDWYLHFHHRTIRDASIGLVAPKIRKDLNIPEVIQQGARATFARALSALDGSWLRSHDFLAGDTVSLADFAAYVEIGQTQARYTNVYDFADLPRIEAWLARMGEVRGHDAAHVVLAELGDIASAAPSMDTIRHANKLALAALDDAIAAMTA